MRFRKEITLENGLACILRNCEYDDGEAVFDIYTETHGETDFLLAYPDESSFTVAQERDFLKSSAESERGIQLCAEIDGKLVGLAGLEPLGSKYKIRHRGEIGISILKDFWGMGLGYQMMEVLMECALSVGITQVELQVVSDNERGLALYKKLGFKEFGRNKKGLNSRISGYQELIYMSLELK